ncbi:methylglyoxal synthase [Natranaerobius thermophilus]|uniref:Methylglyoxal synthase n=1 Tax=Natranaerobius thermophilus (strain ATCC BAA-1301 / DSM 18059 / JW/NM-WN-LF) TaxID=457570 RepID=MGSA_NATTJ|nr:methylglyoxal synthase [Natranaerobius thermophilus]B2A7A5.1 RecName: Full=Methylglyoxal synthase; Short=MGS [Natranaerobius thermophilus JW/NM-WN-LF]ACB84299.1 methylglyoxal synthase [Natranaerobius thermophilus JW/NM-WN-LF]
MRIALIAHDNKKDELLHFIKRYEHVLATHTLCATNSTGRLIAENTNLMVHRYQSGPLGGDQQIGSEIATGNVDFVFFLRDPLTAQPHEPDITALLRICDVHNIPVATNFATAEILVESVL